jgi:uncharacterized membrane protein YbhN (UPF0104 family)
VDRVIRWVLRLVTVAALALGLWFVCRGVSFADVVRVVRSVQVATLAARALPLLAVGFILRAGRFRSVLGPTPVSFAGTVGTVLVAQAANNVLPLHAGELVKTRDFVAAGHPLKRVVVAQGLEKLFELGTLALLCAPAMARALGYGRRMLAIALAAGTLVFVGVALSAGRGGLRPARIGGAITWAFAADAVEVGLVAVTLDALGVASSLGASLVVLGAVNLAIALPSAPGNAGAVEAGAALALVALGASHDRAVAFALLYRIVQWVPVTAGGGVVWALRAARAPEWGAVMRRARRS